MAGCPSRSWHSARWSSADSYALLAIPFFILAGNLMNSGGITSRLIEFANAVVGRFRGGLAQTTVLSTMLFSGISGSAVADATALGKVLIPAMKRHGYSAPFAGALMASASVNGPIIPPSIPMVIYGLSVGKGAGRIDRPGFFAKFACTATGRHNQRLVPRIGHLR
jgi:TRAP-type transport system large permease protein